MHVIGHTYIITPVYLIKANKQPGYKGKLNGGTVCILSELLLVANNNCPILPMVFQLNVVACYSDLLMPRHVIIVALCIASDARRVESWL